MENQQELERSAEREVVELERSGKQESQKYIGARNGKSAAHAPNTFSVCM